MIVRVKTFSGENIYIPEEDYLEQREFANPVSAAARKKFQEGIGKKFLGIRGGTLEQFAADHHIRPDYKAVGRWHDRVMNDKPMTRLQKLKLDRLDY